MADSLLCRLLTDPAARRDPYPFYARLREQPPQCSDRPLDCVALAKYADVSAALRDPARFSSRVMRAADPTLLGADSPQHQRARRLVLRAFTGARLAALRKTIRKVSGQAVRRMVKAGEADVMRELARPLPLAVMRELLGIGPEHEAEIEAGAAAVMAEGGQAPSDADLPRRLRRIEAFIAHTVRSRRERPDTDALSALLQPDATGDALSSEEAGHFVRLLLVAALETSANLLGNTLLALLESPRALARVRRDPALVARAIGETLRYDSPVQMVQRVTLLPLAIGGTAIPAGRVVLLLLGSANRDPRQFADPDRFILSRATGEHLAFGGGAHACVGAQLAQYEVAGAIEALLAGTRRLRVAEPIADLPRTSGLQVRGVTRLPIELRA